MRTHNPPYTLESARAQMRDALARAEKAQAEADAAARHRNPYMARYFDRQVKHWRECAARDAARVAYLEGQANASAV